MNWKIKNKQLKHLKYPGAKPDLSCSIPPGYSWFWWDVMQVSDILFKKWIAVGGQTIYMPISTEGSGKLHF